MKQGVLAAMVVFVIDAAPRWVGACTPVPYNVPHEMDAAFADDTTPPSAVTAEPAQVYRIEASGNDDGCMNGQSSCGSPSRGIVAIPVTASDDRAPPDRIGYRLVIVGGQPPIGTQFPLHDVVASYQSSLELVFSASHEGPFAFDLEIRAVDLNGNTGPPTTIHVAGEL